LRSLDFGVTFPTALRFLERLKKLVNADDLTFNLAHYITQFSLLYICFQNVKPSLVACGAIYLAMKSLRGRSSWNITFVKSTGYKEKLVKQVSDKLSELITSADSKPLKNKFASSKHMEVSSLPIAM